MEIAIDFDGTCVTHSYPLIGNDIGAVPVLKRLVESGHNILLFTMRSDMDCSGSSDQSQKYLTDAVSWFNENGIELYGINENPTQKSWTISPKVSAQLYIDDSALGIPLTNNPDLSEFPFVNWAKTEILLEEMGVLPGGISKSVIKNLYLHREYSVEFVESRLKKIDPNSELFMDDTSIPPLASIHIYFKKEHLFPEVMSVSDWCKIYFLDELNEVAGVDGEFYDVVSDDEGYEISFFWEAKYTPRIKNFIMGLNSTEILHYYKECREYYQKIDGLVVEKKYLLIIYQIIRFWGVSSLIKYIPGYFLALRRRDFSTSVLSFIYIWLIYFWETRHHKTFTLLPPEFDLFLYLPQPPSVIIKDIFADDNFDILLNDEEIIEGIKLTNTCPEMEAIVNQILNNMSKVG